MPFRTLYGQSDQERERGVECRRSHRDRWVVIVREGNYSAFNGYHFTPSDYSCLECTSCGRTWRTKAGYVRDVPDRPQLTAGDVRAIDEVYEAALAQEDFTRGW